jgi:deazaflavin-dependent oxidoreductase (nitroreductase family)
VSLYDRIIEATARTRAGAWFFVRVATHLDRYIMRWTGGRLSSGLGSRFHRSAVLIVTRGAKSGLERTIPLLATPDGRRLILIASNGGDPKHPAWYANLKKTPRCRALFGGTWREYDAREAQGDERARLWNAAVANYAGYGDYQKRVERLIPVMVLTPVA